MNKINALSSLKACQRLEIINHSNEGSINLVKELYNLGVKNVWLVDEGFGHLQMHEYGDTIYLEMEDEIHIDLAMALINLKPDECSYEHLDSEHQDCKYVRLWWD